ncbi:hypothetical protein LCGC14_3005240, partial [marine sediment metagenome]
DPTKLNVFSIGIQYLGAGNTFLYVEDKRTGQAQLVHRMEHAGTLTGPTFTNPTFHLSVIAKTDSGYSGGTLTCATSSMAGFIEGKETEFGVRESASASATSTGTTPVSVLVLHNRLHFNSARNNIQVFPDHITLINEATKSVLISLILNPTQIDGTVALTDVNAASSVMQFDTAGTTIVGGETLIEFSLSASSSKDLDIEHLGLDIHPGDRWVLSAVKTTGGADGVVTCGVSLLERI